MDGPVDAQRAKEIAVRFLEQNYSVLGTEDPVLEGREWKVIVKISSSKQRIFSVRISAKTGRILGF